MTQTQAITGWLNRCPRPTHPRSERAIMRRLIMAASAATALFSSPTFPQQLSQGTASIPDFSGVWAHLTFPDVEPPLSGAGPVRNLSRISIEVARRLNPYNGTVTAGASPSGVSNSSELVGDFTNPILKPQAAEVCFGTSACKWCNRRTKSRFSTQTIMLSATCI